MKKLTAIILTLITLFVFAVPSFAVESGIPAEAFSDSSVTDDMPQQDTEEAEVPSEEPETEQPESVTEDTKVVRMYLCATAASLTGHVWLYFVNLTDNVQMVGWYELPGKDTGKGTVSVGSLRNTRTDGGGTYYNGEAYMGTGKGSVISLYRDLTVSELETASRVIRSRNSYNLFINNCGNFATAVWNAVTGNHIIHVCLPIITIAEMIFHGGLFGQVSMRRPDISECYKQTDKTTSADSMPSEHIRQAQASSFNLSCV